MEAFAVDVSEILFVGDSLRRDIAGAKALGLATVWINVDAREINGGALEPDLEIQDLRDLLDA